MGYILIHCIQQKTKCPQNALTRDSSYFIAYIMRGEVMYDSVDLTNVLLLLLWNKSCHNFSVQSVKILVIVKITILIQVLKSGISSQKAYGPMWTSSEFLHICKILCSKFTLETHGEFFFIQNATLTLLFKKINV